MKRNVAFACNMTEEDIRKAAESGLGLYRRCGMSVVDCLLSPTVHAICPPVRYTTGNRI